MDRTLIDRYTAGAGALTKSVEGLTREQMLTFPVPGKWSVQQLVMHLFDSDLVGADRMRRVIAMERPLLMGYDENAYIARLHYECADTALAAHAFEANRKVMGTLLRDLPDETFQRFGIHSERGLLTLADLVQDYVRHFEHHMKFMREKRKALGLKD